MTDTTTIEVDGIKIEIRRRGMGRPLLVIHGWSADHRYMMADLEPNFDESSTWQRIYFDLPGHGTTIAPDWLDNQTQMLEILTKVIEQAIGDQKFGVIGNSYGGYLSLGLVRKMPHQLLGAALLVPDLPNDLNNRQTTESSTIVEDMTLFGNLQSDEQWIPAGLVEHSQYALDEIRAHDMPGYRASDDDLLERLNNNYLLPVEVRHAGDPFAQPSLIALGHQDATVGYERQLQLLSEFPRATVAVIDMVGHYLGRVERPKVFNALVRDWIERVEISL
ncbi:MAG: alpha/beta hydrolase [Actinobacteria bacterium]|nr:alpha/beta hydrolase [Actinomycetota bacterium]